MVIDAVKQVAYTKNLSMFVAAVLAISLDPALRLFLMRMEHLGLKPDWLCRMVNAMRVGTIRYEGAHPISRVLVRIYDPISPWFLRWKWAVIGGALAMILVTVPAFFKLGSEFMPPLDEGALLYMPSTMPGISITEAQRLLRVTDRSLKPFPEVDRVLSKAGRAETSNDPAPLSMLETVIILKPRSEWRKEDTWYSAWAPDWASAIFRQITPKQRSFSPVVRG